MSTPTPEDNRSDRKTGVTWSSGRGSEGDYACISHESWSEQSGQPDVDVTLAADSLRLSMSGDQFDMYAMVDVPTARRLAQWILDHTPSPEEPPEQHERMSALQAEAWRQGHQDGYLDWFTRRQSGNPYNPKEEA